MTEIGFENRLKEINLAQNPEDWHGILFSAPTGYGKTTLLREIEKIYKEKPPEHLWKVVWIDLQDRQDVSSIWSYIAKNVTGTNIAGKDEREIWTALRTELANREKYILLFDNAGMDKDIDEKLKTGISKLFEINNIDTHAVFAGINLSQADWGEHYIHCALDPFDWLIIQRMLRKKAYGDSYASKVDYQKLAINIYQLSGGHPQAIVGLLDWLKNKRWTIDLADDSDYKTAFNDVNVLKILNDLLRSYNFSDVIDKRIRSLCVFRGINLDLLDELQQSGILGLGVNRLKVWSELNKAGYLTPRAGDIFYRDSIVRGLMLSEMKVNDFDGWKNLHITARSVYQSMLKKTPQTSLQLIYLVESIYHSLQINNMDWVNEDICSAYNIGLDRELLNVVRKDLETRSLLESIHNKKVDELFKNQHPVSPGQAQISVEDHYCSNIVAVVDSSYSAVGTGFFIAYNKKTYVVTCAHVLDRAIDVCGQEVRLRSFDGNNDFKGKIIWCLPLAERKNNTTARQDIAILGLSSNSTPVNPLNLEKSRVLNGWKNCCCYGFGESRKNVGWWIKDITCYEENAGGFVSVKQETSTAKAKFEEGYSGSPLCNPVNSEGAIVGMITVAGSGRVEGEAIIIPSYKIIELISQIEEVPDV